MAKRYVMVRMPKDSFDKFYNKKKKMEQDIQSLVGRRIPLTMPKLWDLVSKNPTEITFDNLLKQTKRGRIKLR